MSHIIREVSLNTSPGASSLSQKIVLYRGDKGICLRFKFTDNQYNFSDINNLKAIVSCIKPNNVSFVTEKTNVTQNYIDVIIEEDFCDEISEIGIYKMQLHIFDGENRVSFEPFTFEVKKSLLLTDVPTVADSALADYSQLNVPSLGEDIITSADISNGYDATSWAVGDVITSNALNKIELNLQDTVNVVNNKKISSNDVKSIEIVPSLPEEGQWENGVLYIVIPESEE